VKLKIYTALNFSCCAITKEKINVNENVKNIFNKFLRTYLKCIVEQIY
jgi:hypothetical protein